ncbi:sulfite exporter TauE/SafE family protein [uncultured Shewanella sp.]|uniref:sulfite exporter TauE/SafE family protein n=1 Tax=uncultured Shewanella sp. TaxID=173975 RepID=UPI0026235ADF|nr:sulfite exporter TauE/SafE family protein [uncultured Shewanella sp.]
MLLSSYLHLIIIGICVGFLSGLLGSGGTTFLVPALSAFFTYQLLLKVSYLHFAVYTALTISALTSWTSIVKHFRYNWIKLSELLSIVPCLVAANLVGLFLSLHTPAILSINLFSLFLLYLSYSILFNHNSELLINKMTFLSTWVGFKSGLFGISGGSIAFPYLLRMSIKLEKSLAITSIITFSLSIIGVIIGLLGGATHVKGAIGFIYWPAIIFVAPFTMLMAPVGQKVALRCPVLFIKLIYSLVMLFSALYILSSV